MGRKPLTAAQSRFLTEHLKLVDFEHRLEHDRLGFLNSFLRGFRLNVPFQTVTIASIYMRSGRYVNFNRDLIEEEVRTGRGGSCGFNNPFIQKFLRSLGFEADLLTGFNAARSLHRDAIHNICLVRNVQRPGDSVYCDAGAWPPLMRAVPVDLDAGDRASPWNRDVHLDYRFVSNASFDAAFEDATRPVSGVYDLRALLHELRGDTALVSLYVKDAVMENVMPFLSGVADGEVIPYHMFPLLKAVKDNDVMNVIKGKGAEKIQRAASRICVVSGFGASSGDFVVFTRDRRVKCHRSNHEGVEGDVILESDAKPEVIVPETRQELVALFNEDFPLLTDSFTDNLEYLDMNEGKKAESDSF